MHLPAPIQEILTALMNSPAVFFIILGLNIFGVMFQQTKLIPDKYNDLIPWLLVVMGVAFTVALVPQDIFPASQQHPKVMLGIVGFLLGFAAYTVHTYPVQWITNFFSSKFGGQPPPHPPPPTSTL